MKETIVIEHVSEELKSNFDRFTFHLEELLGILMPSALQAFGAVPASMAPYLYNIADENELVLFNMLQKEDISNIADHIKIKQYQVGILKLMCRMIAKNAGAGFSHPVAGI
jgi:hypothetical protein